MLDRHAAVGLLGPRQVGKTTLALAIAKTRRAVYLDLEDLRRQKTIVYFITPPQLADYYSFFTSVFLQPVFNAAMRQILGQTDLPLYVLYDEFAFSYNRRKTKDFGRIAACVFRSLVDRPQTMKAIVKYTVRCCWFTSPAPGLSRRDKHAQSLVLSLP